MKHLLFIIVFICSCGVAFATQADDTVITIDGHTAGPTPFISQLTLTASQTSSIKSVQFAITPKPGSSTRSLSGTYSNNYLTERGDIQAGSTTIYLPVYGLYDNYTNTVTLTYLFNDGSSKEDSTAITTTAFDDTCGYKTPTILQAKTSNSLSYDYILLKGACSNYSPGIIDTDGALRWVGTAGLSSYNLAFFNNSVYIADGSQLYRNDLDGTVAFLGDFKSAGVNEFHHNVDRGKVGLLFEADTDSYFESIVMEIDTEGKLVKTWNMADIIKAAMTAGGDDPNKFVYPSPTDWFHNNAVAYNRADDSLIVSSRENFLICIDYSTGAIKWILGDPTKAWYQFPSLRKYALTLSPGSLPPIGQHAVSVTYNQDLMVFDNGMNSMFQQPPGAVRTYASPRRYQINLPQMTATEVANYPMDGSVYSPYCGSSYEDQPLSFLVDYAFVNSPSDPAYYARILGINSADEKVFYYQYPTVNCNTVFNAVPLHLENTALPAIGPEPRNLSTRGLVGVGDNSLIGGLIVNGNEPRTLVLRALGPSLASQGLPGTVTDPVLRLVDASGNVVATNDNWANDRNASLVTANGLAPANATESAILRTLAPGAYTFVVSSKDATSSGIGLVEAYDLSPLADSRLANLSTRGLVGTNDNVLIAGLIVGDVANDTLLLRGLGPSLAAAGVTDPLSDPMLTVYDANGAVIAANDNWKSDPNERDIIKNGHAPTNAAESATILHLPAGAYTAVLSGANGTEGIGLAEIYDLD
jgi:hypothetical protein